MNQFHAADIVEIKSEDLNFSEWNTLSKQHLGSTVHEIDYLYFSKADPDGVFADIGANIGNSIHSISLVNPDLKVLAFEPNPGLWSLIESVINNVSNDVTLFKFGLSNQNSFFDLYIPVVDNIHIVGEASVSLEHFYDSFIQSRLRSYSTTGDFSLIKTKVSLRRFDGLNLNPSYVKIDVEGHELQVLQGMTETINRCKPTFLIESDKSKQVDKFLENFGYTAFNYEPNSEKLVPKQFDTLNTFFLPA